MKKKVNKKSGISLMVLAITVVVMIILASATVVSYNSIIQDTLKKDFASEIYSIQKLVSHYIFMYNEYPGEEEIIFDISDIDEKYLFEFSKENISDLRFNCYIIDLEKCDVELTKRGVGKNLKDIYVVSKDTGIVYYMDGVVIDNIIYYTLTDDLKNDIGL